MNIFVHYAILTVTSACIAITFNASKKHFLKVVFVGVLSAALNMALTPHLGAVSSIAISAFSMALVSQFISRYTKSPSQGFLIVGAIFLVPGLKILKMLNQIQEGSPIYVFDTLYEIVAILCTISFSVLMAAALLPNHRDL